MLHPYADTNSWHTKLYTLLVVLMLASNLTAYDQLKSVVGSPVAEVHDSPELLLLLPRFPPRGRRRGATGGGRRQRVRVAAGASPSNGAPGALLGRAERVVPAAEPRLVLEGLHRAHAHRRRPRRRLRLAAPARHACVQCSQLCVGSMWLDAFGCLAPVGIC